jgi:osmotically-inducible protein OsmY
MGEDRTRPKDETPIRPGVQGLPTRGAGRGAAPDEPAAGIAATHAAESSSGRMQADAAVPRLEVRLPPEAEKSDEAIAERALQALFSGAPLRRERILMRIARGRVTLSGSVGTDAERVAVERLVGDTNLFGSM